MLAKEWRIKMKYTKDINIKCHCSHDIKLEKNERRYMGYCANCDTLWSLTINWIKNMGWFKNQMEVK